MKTNHFKKLIMSSILLGLSQVSWAACDQTLSPGANVASAVSSAAVGSTICLNAGNYGRVELFNIARSGYVTIRSASGKSASIAPQVGKTNFVRLESLTISDVILQNSCSTHVQWVNNDFPAKGLTLSNSGCGSLDTLIDGNSFTNFNVGGGYEGRLSLVYGSGITVSNNFFGNGGASDGIQMIGGVSNVNIVNNTFSGILESLCGSVHCDAIQLYGTGNGIVINSNFFTNGDTFIMAPDGSDGVTITNNVFNGVGVSYPDKIQFGSANGARFEHNTLTNVRASFDSKTGSSASNNVIAKNNILASGSNFKTEGGSGCASCTFTNNFNGNPTFAGGSNPTTFAGFLLATNSLGINSATDGKNMGIAASSTVATPPVVAQLPLIAPTNLRVN
jgi:hypothetical protein